METQRSGRTKAGVRAPGKIFRCVILAALAVLSAGEAWADPHPTGVPALNSRLGAAYTVYLDFEGFNFSGNWSGKTPGAQPAYDNVASNGSFSVSDQANMTQIWERVAEKYAPFNINVTTVDPAIAAGKAGTDALREAYYDNTAKMMHTVIGDQVNSWYGSAGGVSYIGVTANSQSGSNGEHTNWIFTNYLGGASSLHYIAEAASHENGHGLALWHQSDYTGSTLVNEYSQNIQGVATGAGSVAPIMGGSYYSQRGTWRVGDSEQGSKVPQNDLYAILNRNTGLPLIDDGVGHSLVTATEMPLGGGNVNFTLAKGYIAPASSNNPQPIGVANYTSDYFLFHTTGGSVTLSVVDGSERITPGAADPGATLASTLQILNSAGTELYSVSDNSNLTETITQTLTAGNYYARISSYGGTTSSYDGSSAYYYDMGSYFLTGSGLAATATPSPGDANADGKVDFTDFQAMLDHWQFGTSIWSQGDFNQDGKVDFADFQVLLDHWNPAGTSSVPEPATLTMLTLAALGLVRRRSC